MKRWFKAAAGALAITAAAGGLVSTVGVPAASAHHPVVSGEAICVEDTPKIKWTVTADAVRNYTWAVNGEAAKPDNQSFVFTNAQTSFTAIATWYHQGGSVAHGPETRVGGPVALRTDCAPRKVNICHRDQGNPEWKVIEISENALQAHLSHQWGEDIYPVPAEGCPVPPPPADGEDETFTTCVPGDNTVTVTRTPYTWERVGGQWVKKLGAAIVTTRLLTDRELESCRPENPESESITETIGTPECGDTTVQTRTTVTHFTFEYLEGTWTRVETGTAEISFGSRSLTEEEQAALDDECAPPNSLETWHTVECGTATIYLRNVSPWIYPVTHTVDGGAEAYGPVVDNRTDGGLGGPQKDQTGSKTFTFGEDTGVHTIAYVVKAGSENDLYVGLPVGEWTEFTVESDCQENTTVPPTTQPPVTTAQPPVTTTEPPATTIPETTVPVVDITSGPETSPAPPVPVDELPVTGGGSGGLLAAASAALSLGLVSILLTRRRKIDTI